jgi:acetyltransferase
MPTSTGVVPSVDAGLLLMESAINISPVLIAQSVDEALQAANYFGYPLALKIESPDIAHKTEVEGVILNVANADALREAFPLLLERVKQHKPFASRRGYCVSWRHQRRHASWSLVFGSARNASFDLE